MSVVDSSFSNVGGRSLSSLLNLVTATDISHQFFSQISAQAVANLSSNCYSAKIGENDTKFRKIKTKNILAVYHLYLKIGSSKDSFKEAYLNY